MVAITDTITITTVIMVTTGNPTTSGLTIRAQSLKFVSLPLLKYANFSS
jgi:hypothetical protein